MTEPLQPILMENDSILEFGGQKVMSEVSDRKVVHMR